MNPTETAAVLMRDFAERTGVSPARDGRRYLWTDAFAVCNFLALARRTGDERHAEMALALVDRVHRTLGRHRADDPRHGWLSALDERAGEKHPTRGGLRIGKDLPERGAGDPMDRSLEWDRDGQYFHYLTRWMHALDQVSRFHGERRFNLWARELAHVAHDAFCYGTTGRRRMHWKMSIDLTRPLVPSMGQHDPVEGYVTCLQLDATSIAVGAEPTPRLEEDAADFASMLRSQELMTTDPLGIGGLLADAWRLAQLHRSGALVDVLLRAGLAGLTRYERLGVLDQPADRRLAFRELGLAIGLEAVERLRRGGNGGPERPALAEAVSAQDGLRTRIEGFWLDPANRANATWEEHRDINEVMLATALLPDGYVTLDRIVPRRAA